MRRAITVLASCIWALLAAPALAVVDGDECDNPFIAVLGTNPAVGVLDSCRIAAGQAPDVNGNGVPDSCESLIDSCPTDLNNDGQTGAADLALLLGAWGACPSN